MRRLVVASMLLASVASSARAGETIGHVKTLSGEAFVVRAGASAPASLGTALEAGDTIATGHGGAMGITLKDNTMVSIGPDTEYTMDEFVFEPREQKLGFASRITKGTLQFVSGTIAKLSPDSVKIATPTGTLGVRGTRFVVRVDD